MSAKVKYNITCKVGSYTDREGNSKGKYKTVGMVMEKDDNSRFIFIDPLFNFGAVNRGEKDMVICSLMEPKEKEDKPKQEAWEE